VTPKEELIQAIERSLVERQVLSYASRPPAKYGLYYDRGMNSRSD
jgi:hypothetical protein